MAEINWVFKVEVERPNAHHVSQHAPTAHTTRNHGLEFFVSSRGILLLSRVACGVYVLPATKLKSSRLCEREMRNFGGRKQRLDKSVVYQASISQEGN